ncbi:MAG TPA: OB-fold domain-containing protein [Alphaproteobacteria bacterium]|jgi:hypothetical protein|nr:OB-fold domain-containing protein [Alphaproteobacteria bacterium]MDP7427280.1 OB-fold domain-containing protein [Alphaproteobacteria bacterium]MDP7603357.1 OB-fold domain-containing protein [Alphaproteobacteria bacterium]HJM50564.1 OB-fold domain-containing protein [Alphaproteobacteria bacterium]
MAEAENNFARQPEFEPFWQGLRDGHFELPRCGDCGRFHWYPMIRCPHCISANIVWSRIDGRGRLYSWTVVRRAFAADFEDKVPYTVGLVEFGAAPGVRFVSEIVVAPAQALVIDMPVEPLFPATNEALPRILFAAVES